MAIAYWPRERAISLYTGSAIGGLINPGIAGEGQLLFVNTHIRATEDYTAIKILRRLSYPNAQPEVRGLKD